MARPNSSKSNTYRKPKHIHKCGCCGKKLKPNFMIQTSLSTTGWFCCRCWQHQYGSDE